MIEKRCHSCGGLTNSNVSFGEFKDEEATYCYAKVVDGVWVKGCKYKDADIYLKSYIDKRLLGKKI